MKKSKNKEVENVSENDVIIEEPKPIIENNPFMPNEITPDDPVTNEKKDEIANTTELTSASPYSLDIIKKDDKDLLLLSIIGTSNDNKLILFNKIYHIETKEDLEAVKKSPFFIATDFVSVKSSESVVANLCEIYQSNFDFYTIEDDINKFYFIAEDMKNGKNKVRVNVDANIMSCLAFYDLFVTKNIYNVHSFSIACLAAATQDKDFTTDTYYPDNVDALVIMAPAVVAKKKFKKGTTEIIAEFKYTKFLNSDEKDTCTLLAPFDIGIEFTKSKFKNHTLEEIQKEYLKDADHYMSEFIVNKIHLFGIDKEYMLVRAINKDKKVRLFMLSTDIQSVMINNISDY